MKRILYVFLLLVGLCSCSKMERYANLRINIVNEESTKYQFIINPEGAAKPFDIIWEDGDTVVVTIMAYDGHEDKSVVAQAVYPDAEYNPPFYIKTYYYKTCAIMVYDGTAWDLQTPVAYQPILGYSVEDGPYYNINYLNTLNKNISNPYKSIDALKIPVQSDDCWVDIYLRCDQYRQGLTCTVKHVPLDSYDVMVVIDKGLAGPPVID